MTIGSARLFAPVAAPPPPKPPQLNIVASSLMPDVATDTFGPGAGPLLAAGGWEARWDDGLKRYAWDRPPGDTLLRTTAEKHNALVAAIGTMSDVEMKQVEQDAGVTTESLPVSLFGATADSRWTGGFRYAPENQYESNIADPCGQLVDLPAFPPPVALAAVQTTGGDLADDPYKYEVTGVNDNGETTPSNAVTVTVASGGSAAAVSVSWTSTPGINTYKVYGRVSGSLGYLATVNAGPFNVPTTVTFLDTGADSPGVSPPTGNTSGGPGEYTNLPEVKYVPFLIQVEDECSAFGFSERDYVGRVLRLLDNATPNALERELWQGIFAQNTFTGPMGGSNAFFQQSSTSADGGTGVTAEDLTPSTVPSMTRGVQILEDYLANSGFGGQGMLHVAPETSPNLLGARRIGSLLLTVMDNIVVPGSGYPTTTTPGGSTPAASGPIGATNATPLDGQAWIFASDLVSVRLDKAYVTPETMAAALDRGIGGQPNTIRFRAQRFGAATFDVARLAATRVTLST